jgi:hypothetical protein
MSTIYSVAFVHMDGVQVTLHSDAEDAHGKVVEELETSALQDDDVDEALPGIRKHLENGEFERILEIVKEIYDGSGMSFTVTEHDCPL